MSERYPGGLITKTPVIPTTTSAPGIWTLDQALQYIKAGTWPGLPDPYFPYVTMLLHGDGTNGAQNNTFLDSSTNNFSITRNGNTTQGSFSPYGSNWSNYFGGSSDYLSLSGNAALTFGTGDFCIEGWINPTSTSGEKAIIGNVLTNTTTTWVVEIYSNYLRIAQYSPILLTSSSTIPANTWTHFAITRSGTTLRLFINGVLDNSTTNSTDFSDNSTGFRIGDVPYGAKFGGNISNLRLVKGSAVYTSAFTPSTTPLTAISGTSLLTCQSNRFIDNSTNAFAITVNGTPSVQRFSPFSPIAAYSTSTIGGSGYFDSSGDYLTMGRQSALDLGASDWTFEAYVYIPSLSFGGGIGTIFGSLLYDNGFGAYAFWVNSTNFVTYIRYNSGTLLQIDTAIASNLVGRWSHLAVTRSGSNLRIFLNGVQQGSTNTTLGASSIDAAYAVEGYTTPYTIGGMQSRGTFNGFFNGYISNLRLVKGTAVYTSNFTPPTAPVTAITNTQLLTNFTNGGIFDNAMMNNLETVGNAQISTSVVKFGTGSLAFDGTGDGLALPANVNLAIGSGNFTIEMWINGSVSNNNTTKGGSFARAFTLGTAQGTGNIEVYFNDSNNCIISISAGTNIQFASSSILSSAWVHFAIVRSGTTLTAYANGTSVGSTTNSTDLNLAATTQSWIGAISSSAGTFNGYIDDLRITKGYARYTSNFTPPTAAFQNQ